MGPPKTPVLGKNVYISETAFVAGDVEIGDQSTIMHHVMIRGDIAPIRLGSRVNVQDGSILHVQRGVPLEIADDVGIGHRAVVHCRRVGTRTLIATGAIVLDGCEVGQRCIIAAGTLLPPGTKIPDGHVVMGLPGKIVRETTAEDIAVIDHVVRSYQEIGRAYASGAFPNVASHRHPKRH